MTDLHSPSRRELLLASGVLFAWAHLPKIALAEGRDPRLMVVILRGALDGLAAVAPVGDPNWVKLRGDSALTLGGTAPALPLNDFFALHPAMPALHRLYKAKQATILHAAATPYRARSHFDGQDVLESGYPTAGYSETGWLNRAVATLTPGAPVTARGRSAFAIGSIAPLVVRGPAPIVSWAPPTLPSASDDTLARLLDLYRHTNPTLAQALEERVGLEAIVGAEPMSVARRRGDRKTASGIRTHFARQAEVAAKFLSRPDGPRIGAISLEGWDTHSNEGIVDGRMAALLGALDGAIEAIEKGMGSAWRETVVIIATEFGRTARINGSYGTDHGTATVAFLIGGALKGGRVIADWPGLRTNDLYEGRDLKPTADLRAAFKGVLAEHLGVPDAALDKTIFPETATLRPLRGLLA